MKRGVWQAAIGGSLAAALVAGCADVASFARTGVMPQSADLANGGSKTGAESSGVDFILVPRSPGQPLEKIRGGAPVGSNAGGLVGNSPDSAPSSADSTGGQAGASPSPVLAPPSSPCEETATTGLFATAAGPVLATAKGVYSRSGDAWQRIAAKFPCGTVPAAIAPAGADWYAAAADGIYRAGGQSLAWTPVASATAVVDLDITPDASFGIAVQEDGRPYLFDGTDWARQSYRFLSPLGGVRAVSATESYVVGANLLYRGDAKNTEWALLPQPDTANSVAGLAVRRPSGSNAELIATTRAGLYRYSATGWTAELGPDPALYLGLPTFSGALGFVSGLGAAEGAAYRYASATWQAAPAPPAPIDTTAVLQNGDTLALAIDGESLYLLAGGTWRPVSLP